MTTMSDPVRIVTHEGEVGEGHPLPVDIGAAGALDVSELWKVSKISDVVANDSDKTFTVPADTEYQILSIYIKLVTSATVGNRQIVVQFTDGVNIIGRYIASVVQAASLTRYYMFAIGAADMLGFRDTDLLGVNMGVGSFLPAGYVIRVWDNKAIDAAADDMDVHLLIASRAV